MANENILLNKSFIYSNSLLIKLQPDTNGRYGFNIKVDYFIFFPYKYLIVF